MMPYNKILEIVTPLANSSHLRMDIEALENKDFDNLRSYLPLLKKKLTLIQEITNDVQLDRTIDYPRYIKHAHKHFNEADIQILESMIDTEYSYNYSDIMSRLDVSPPMANATLRKQVRRLIRLGLLLHQTGLFDEDDGTPAGSGFGINERRRSIIENIIESYRAIDKQESLL